MENKNKRQKQWIKKQQGIKYSKEPAFETTRVFKQYRLYSTLGVILDYARRSTAFIAR